MGTKLSQQDLELYRRIDEVLFYLWDPIGVSGTPEARDEYHAYLPVVFSMLKQNKEPNEVARYLTRIERERMGFDGGEKQDKRNLEIALLLEDHKLVILEKFSRTET